MTLTDEEIKSLIEEKNETPNRDYKESLIWDRANKDGYLEVVKDILAMANTQDGGKIIFGVEDGTFNFLGISDESYSSFDVTTINQSLHNYADPAFTCNLIKKEIDGKKVVIIDVPEFPFDPIVCKDAAHSSKGKEVLKKGGIYIRTKKCTSELVSTADEMRSILEKALDKKSDEILGKITRLLRASSKNALSFSPSVSPSASPSPSPSPEDESPEIVGKNEYVKEIKEAHDFFETKLDSKFGYWEVIAYPTTYSPNRIANPVQANQIADESSVHLRGWNFPHNDGHGGSTNFNKGRQSVTIWENRHQEAWRMYKSGLFIWKEFYMEDMEEYNEDGKKVMSFINIIYSFTEFLLFMKRVYTEKLSTESVYFSITLYDCEGRKLVSLQPGVHIYNYISGEKTIQVERTLDSVELQASSNDIARDCAKEVFMLFNWNDPSGQMIEDWQKKLIERGG